MSKLSDLKKKIEEKTASIFVLGLGYIGLPTALFYKKYGFNVIGIDTNLNLIEDLRDGRISIDEEGMDELAREHLGQIQIRDNYDTVHEGDIFVLCLPSPIDSDKNPVLGYLKESIIELATRIKKGALILIESTVPVGTTTELADLFGKESGLKLDRDFWFAHTPERVLPGQMIQELSTNHRIVGGVSEESTKITQILDRKSVV